MRFIFLVLIIYVSILELLPEKTSITKLLIRVSKYLVKVLYFIRKVNAEFV